MAFLPRLSLYRHKGVLDERRSFGVPVRERSRDCPAERPAADGLPDGLWAGYPTVRRRPDGARDYWAVAETGFPEDDFARGWALAEETLAEVGRRAAPQGDVAFTDTWPVLIEVIKAADAAGGETAHGFFARIWCRLRGDPAVG